ncbi:saccharopine dehydrogenase [Alphaproteobacteria bacterium GH1-50]|uniref:Saccharopine dehydrogenase [NAD(+), L-lysine-forming] n=1 Tax=Kangsaoukella pontilimi TaxID=2691042 RepID=A0A7C9MGF4_9RHOB|nr:saccharopine dehydrogenase [Kangsaoukella pontilimi]MXQ09512.1 saccharopine dehydrogenase [Kangsaoukella pontilimi]
MTHLWVRAETRGHERRVGITPEGVSNLIEQGMEVTVEEDTTRVIPLSDYVAAGAGAARTGGWVDAPSDAIIFGLKELPESDAPLVHRHIMFGHAFKEQAGWQAFLDRFRRGEGALYDLEYLVDGTGRRVAAFGYWAGYAGAAMSLLAVAAQHGSTDAFKAAQGGGGIMDAARLAQAVRNALAGAAPAVIVIGAKGRVGGGAVRLCREVGLDVTEWDMAETAHGGPFPEILQHEVFLNCILAAPGVPLFVGPDALTAERRLRVIGDIACDPTSEYSPVPVYDAVTSWDEPVTRVADASPLDVMAIDNLPSLLPRESSEDFAAQLFPFLERLDRLDEGVWGRAEKTFRHHLARL